MTFRIGQPVFRTWTVDRIAVLRELAAPGELSTSEIAQRMGLTSRNAVIGACRRYGIALRPKNAARWGDVRPKAKAKKTNFNFAAPAFKREPFKASDVKCEPLHLALQNKSSSQCSYPYGDGPFTFCGHPVVEGYSYCQAHKELCLVKPVRPDRAKPFVPQRGRAA